MTKKILVIGSSNTDVLIQVPYMPKVGETILGGKCHIACGGKGANQAVAAKRSGGEVKFIACVGDDAFGKMALDSYAKDGIDISKISVLTGEPTGLAQIMVDSAGHNLIAVAPEANLLLTPEVVANAHQEIKNCDILLLQLEVPLESVLAAIDLAFAAQKTIILNPAPAQKIPEEYLAKLDYITPNETEAEILTGVNVSDEQSAATAAQWFLSRAVKNVIITLGARGVFFANGHSSQLVTGFKVNALDTTGAGDTFNGGFVTALSLGEDVISAIRYGQKTAAISVTRLGTQTSMPYRDEILTTELTENN